MKTAMVTQECSGSGFHFEVACPVRRPILNILRRFVSSVAEEMGFCTEDITKIEMAVDEACSNVFMHAYGGPGDDAGRGMQLKLKIGNEDLTIQIEDKGRGLDQTQITGLQSMASYQRLDRENYHGLGLLIMQEFMDDVSIDGSTERGTLVTLRKVLKQAPSKAETKR